MVLDIRHLRFPEGEEEKGRDPGQPAESDLLAQLLDQAGGGETPEEQVRAVEQLRRLVPGPEGIDLLWEILVDEGDPRRLIAAQVLGFHRQWIASRSRLKHLLELARRERDEAVGRAMVWSLRQRSEIGEFLRHRIGGMAREAALGLPVNRQTLPCLLDALLEGPEPGFPLDTWSGIDRILLDKLHSIHPSLVRHLVGLLLQRRWDGSTDRLAVLFECLPQLPLFALFVEERQAPGWDPSQEEESSRARTWRRLERAARRVMERAPRRELLRHLLARSSEDEVFARRHARFLRAVMHGAHPDASLIAHFERLTSSASEEGVARLAQLLVELGDRLEGEAGVQARALLEEWKSRSPDLKLKIYQLENGLGEGE